jgi:ferredoxin
MPETEHTLEESRNLRARSAAQGAAERLTLQPTGVVKYESRGRVLVVGGEEAQWFAARLADPLHAEILLTEGEEEAGVPTTSLGGRSLSIKGHLGAFRIELGEKGRHNHQLIDTDLVVDLGAEPLIASEIPPPGYWRFGREPADLDAAWLAVDGMVGTFEKPRYFAYDPAVCAHGRAGQGGCSRCIDACPADAILSIGETVEVNPNLCQGGGICASVCPTGAMRYAYPAAGDTAERVRVMLKTYLEAGGSDPVVMFIADSDAADLPPTPPNVLLTVVEELASVGHELWLAAIAWGARCVLLADGGSVPGKARRALDQQIAYGEELLRGLGYQPDALRGIDTRSAPAACQPAGGLPAPAHFAATGDKRQMAGMALGHLWSESAERPEAFLLSPGAPYGRILVDTEKCTLCMGCTSVCPARALSAGDDTPRLVFHEANCVQCSICANACPETAIRLEPRLLADPEKRRQPLTLHEEPPLCCVACGKPFATRRVIDNILDKLAGHAMFQSDRARRRLQMCEDCRVVDAVQDTEAMQSGLALGPIHRSENGKSS